MRDHLKRLDLTLRQSKFQHKGRNSSLPFLRMSSNKTWSLLMLVGDILLLYVLVDIGDGIKRDRRPPVFTCESSQEFGSVVRGRVGRGDIGGWLWARPWRSGCGRCVRRGVVWWVNLYGFGVTHLEAVHADGALLLGFAHLHVLDELAEAVRQSVAFTVRPGIFNLQRQSLV